MNAGKAQSLRDCAAVFKDSRDVGFHPLGQWLNMGSQFEAEWGKAVLHLRRLRWKDNAQHKAICLECVKRVREHAFTDAADAPRQFAEAMSLFEQHHQNERTPPGRDVIENLT